MLRSAARPPPNSSYLLDRRGLGGGTWRGWADHGGGTDTRNRGRMPLRQPAPGASLARRREQMPARVCGCSFCTKHGGVWTSHPAARLVLRIADTAEATRYRFGTGTADFHVCRACGAVPAVTCALEGRVYAVVNVNCLEGIDPATLDRIATDSRAKPRRPPRPAPGALDCPGRDRGRADSS